MSLDQEVFRALRHRAGEWPAVDRPLLACARSGSFAQVSLMLLVGICRGADGRRALWRCLAAVAALYPVCELSGRLVRRERPFSAGPGVRQLLQHSAGRSFPSRHVASAVAMSIVVGPAAPRAAGLMAVLAGGLSVGRVRAGLHYPSDVLAGAALGAIVGGCLGAR